MPAEYLPMLAAGMIFLTIILLMVGVMQLVRANSKRREVVERIQSSGRQFVFGQPESMTAQDAPSPGFTGRIMAFLGLVGQKMARDKVTDHTTMRPRFLKAGIRSHNAPAAFWGVKIILPLLLPLCYGLLRILAPEMVVASTTNLLIIILSALAGFYLPDLWLSNKIQKRRQEILKGFPDALDLLVVCVEAGMGLDSAISRVSKESRSNNQLLSEELHLFTLETRAGMPRKDALRNLAMRTDLQEMQNLATLLIQTEKFGTSVSQALKVFSESMRTERFQRAEEKAAKIPIKLLFPLILFIFPSLFVAILGPAIIRISQTFMSM